MDTHLNVGSIPRPGSAYVQVNNAEQRPLIRIPSETGRQASAYALSSRKRGERTIPHHKTRNQSASLRGLFR
jgi:hypothetical protein